MFTQRLAPMALSALIAVLLVACGDDSGSDKKDTILFVPDAGNNGDAGNGGDGDTRNNDDDSGNNQVDCDGDKVAEGGVCVCPSGTIELDNDECASTLGCPDNSFRVDDGCECVEGFVVNPAGTACVPPEEACPTNSHFVENDDGGACQCDDGFVVNTAGNGCVPREESCPDNAHIEGDACVCDEGYQANRDGDACVLPEDYCDDDEDHLIVNGVALLCCPNGANAALVNGTPACTCSGDDEFNPDTEMCEAPPACPDNATRVAGDCQCNPGFTESDDGMACLANCGDLASGDTETRTCFEEASPAEGEPCVPLEETRTCVDGELVPTSGQCPAVACNEVCADDQYNLADGSCACVAGEDEVGDCRTSIAATDVCQAPLSPLMAPARQDILERYGLIYDDSALQVEDKGTGLVWTGCTPTSDGSSCAGNDGTNMLWEDAVTFCEDLSWGGHNDWRLPSLVEWTIALNQNDEPQPFMDYMNVLRNREYWTSDVSYLDPTHHIGMYTQENRMGQSHPAGATPASMRVRCVRNRHPLPGNACAQRTTEPGQEPVNYLPVRGIFVQGCPLGTGGSDCSAGEPTLVAGTDAEATCDTLTWGGFSDWRLPTINELWSLFDYNLGIVADPNTNEVDQPQLHPSLFPRAQRGYWTGETNDVGRRHAVDFFSGGALALPTSSVQSVMCVRGCPTGFTGLLCDTCAPGYEGAECNPTAPSCGDGQVTGNETCEGPTPSDDSDGCDTSCRLAYDESEPNDELIEANAVGSLGDGDSLAVTAQRFGDGDVDHFRFTLDQDSSIDILLSAVDGGSCEPELDLTLYDDEGTLIRSAFYDTAGCGELEARRHSELRDLPAGDYVVAVEAERIAGFVRYQLDIRVVAVCGNGVHEHLYEECDAGTEPDGLTCNAACTYELADSEPNDEIATATNLGSANGRYSGRVDARDAGQITSDFYRVTLQEGQSLSAEVRDGIDLGCNQAGRDVTALRVYDAVGELLVEGQENVTDDCWSLDAFTEPALNDLPAGDYVVEVDFWTGSGDLYALLITIGNSGGLTAPQPLALGLEGDVWRLAEGDLDGDGRDDLLALDRGVSGTDPAIVVMYTDGSAPASLPLTSGATYSALSVADIDGDDIADLALYDAEADTIELWRGQADGSLNNLSITPQSQVYTLALGDLNGDQLADLVVSKSTHDVAAQVYLAQETPTDPSFPFAAPSDITSVDSRRTELVIDDFDGDGHQDVLLSGDTDREINVLLGNGSGAMTLASTTTTSESSTEIYLVDLDGDDDLDLVTNANNAVVIYHYMDDDTYALAQTVSFDESFKLRSVASGDFDGDGLIDLALGSYFLRDRIVVFRGDGTGGVIDEPHEYRLSADPDAMIARDTDGDSNLDITVAAGTEGLLEMEGF